MEDCQDWRFVVRSYGSNMAAAEAKLSFDLAVDSVLDSLERKFILKEEQRCSTTSCKQCHLLPQCLLAEFLSLYIRHLE